eukprot:gene42888-53211_t
MCDADGFNRRQPYVKINDGKRSSGFGEIQSLRTGGRGDGDMKSPRKIQDPTEAALSAIQEALTLQLDAAEPAAPATVVTPPAPKAVAAAVAEAVAPVQEESTAQKPGKAKAGAAKVNAAGEAISLKAVKKADLTEVS